MLTKTVTGSDDLDFNLVEYPYQIWYKDSEGNPQLLTNENAHIGVVYQNSTQKVDYLEHYTPPNSTVTYDSVFLLNPDKIAEICFPEEPMMYKGHKIFWIESKASFGDAAEFKINSNKQLIPYTELFGPGVVVYWTGYLDGLACPEGVTLEDIGILEKKLSKWKDE
jgi:hypothetical protein